MKKITFFLLVAVFSFSLGRFYVKSPAIPVQQSAPIINETNTELIKLEQRYQQLLLERTSLMSSGSSSASAQLKTYPKRVVLPMPTKEQIDKMVQDRMEFYKKVDVKNIYNVFSKKFEEESRSVEASAEREALIYELHSKLPDLQKYTLKSVDCRDEHCRVEIFYQLLSDMDSVVSDFNDAIFHSEFAGLFSGGAENIAAPERNLMAVYISIKPESSFYD